MGSTNPLAAQSIDDFAPAAGRSNRAARQLQDWFDAFSSSLIKNPWPLFILGAAITATHLLIIVFQPRHALDWVALCGAAASMMQAVVLLIHARRSHGTLALRWLFLAITFSLIALVHMRGPVSTFTSLDFPTLRVVLIVLLTCFALFALTLPSQDLRTDERILDAVIALAFCAFRFFFLSNVMPPDSSHALARVLMDSGIQTVVALLAYLSARSADRIFFRTAAIAAVVLLVPAISVSGSGLTMLHQHASALCLIDTVGRVGCALYFYFVLFQQDQNVEDKPYQEALGSIVPFVLTALIVFLSSILLPTHPYLGYSGVAFGLAAFLLRIAFLSRRTGKEVVIGESLLREIVSEVVKSEFLTVADRATLESALTSARRSVGPHSPVSLILFWIAGISNLPDNRPDQKSLATATIAQAISHWQTPAGTVCDMGDGMFVMLLPATPLRVAMPLAEQVCRSLDSLHLDEKGDASGIVAGVATCTEPANMVSLLQNASAALERAQQKRDARVRSMQPLEEAAFDS